MLVCFMTSELDAQKSVAYRMMACGIEEGLDVSKVLDVGAASVNGLRLEFSFRYMARVCGGCTGYTAGMKEVNEVFGDIFSEDEIKTIWVGHASNDLVGAMRGLAKKLSE